MTRPQVSGVLEPPVPGGAVGHEPGDLVRLIGGVVQALGPRPHLRLVVLPPDNHMMIDNEIRGTLFEKR